MSSQLEDEEPVRLLFEMSRDDNPRLYDDLRRFRKGTKRVNRLRLLAYEGLLALQAAAGGRVPPRYAGEQATDKKSSTQLAQAFMTNQVFGMPEADA